MMVEPGQVQIYQLDPLHGIGNVKHERDFIGSET